MPNRQNIWRNDRRVELKRELGGKCTHRGCGEHRLSYLNFSHVKSTPLSRTGSREPKMVLADVNKHRDAYKLKCDRHHYTDAGVRAHDLRMRRLGHR